MIKAEFVLVGFLDTSNTFQTYLDKQGEGVWLPLYIRKLLEVADAPEPSEATPEATPDPAPTTKTRKPRAAK
jgi:hypothetical protein